MPQNSTEAVFFCKVENNRHSFVHKWKCIWGYPQKQLLIGPMQNLCTQYRFLVSHYLLLKNSSVKITYHTSVQRPFLPKSQLFTYTLGKGLIPPYDYSFVIADLPV